ncbi:MAG: nucleotide pyrophosphohydrolase [Desulfobacterales bacterium]
MDKKFEHLYEKILKFRDERDWAKFHDPKNLSQAISIEASELQEIFLWKTNDQSRNLTEKEIHKVKEELADVFIFMMYMCNEFGIDLLREVEKKLAINGKKYPVEKARGTSKKYTDL